MQHRDTVPKKPGWVRRSACHRHGAPAAGAPHLTARCPARCGQYQEREFSVTKSAHSTHQGFTHGLLLGWRCPSSTAGMGDTRCCLAQSAQGAQDKRECLGCYRGCSSSAPTPPASASTWRFAPPGHSQPLHIRGGQGSQEKVRFARFGKEPHASSALCLCQERERRSGQGHGCRAEHLHFLLANPSSSPGTARSSLPVFVALAPSGHSSSSSPSTFPCPCWGNHCLGTASPLQISNKDIWDLFGTGPASSPTCARNVLPTKGDTEAAGGAFFTQVRWKAALQEESGGTARVEVAW